MYKIQVNNLILQWGYGSSCIYPIAFKTFCRSGATLITPTNGYTHYAGTHTLTKIAFSGCHVANYNYTSVSCQWVVIGV